MHDVIGYKSCDDNDSLQPSSFSCFVIDSEAFNQVFQTAKAQAFALFNEAHILLEERVVDLEQHNSLLSGNLESVYLRLREVTVERL